MSQRTFALKLEYDGTAYSGSQLQANAPTIQQELERALAPLAGRPVRAAFAGRTDAGVHAAGQVAAVVMSEKWRAEGLVKALNALLPSDIAVRAAVEVPGAFDPRRWAVRRRYRYQVYNRETRAPLLRRTAWFVYHALQDQLIAEAVAPLVGEHDFAAFAGPVEAGASTIRRMLSVQVRREGSLLVFEFEAEAFLPHQVRRTVGALVQIGRGRLEAGAIARYLADAQPGLAGPAAPPHGLCLMDVVYSGLRFEVGDYG